MKVMILNGPGEAGKGEFLVQLGKSDLEAFLLKHSSIAWAKEVATNHFGWKGQKDPLSRDMLTNIKQAGIEYGNIPHNKLVVELINFFNHSDSHAIKNPIFVTDIREPSEITKMVWFCEAKGWPCLTVRIQNTIKEQEAKEKLGKGDNEWALYEYDCTISNNGTIKDFKREIKYHVGLWSFLL